MVHLHVRESLGQQLLDTLLQLRVQLRRVHTNDIGFLPASRSPPSEIRVVVRQVENLPTELHNARVAVIFESCCRGLRKQGGDLTVWGALAAPQVKWRRRQVPVHGVQHVHHTTGFGEYRCGAFAYALDVHDRRRYPTTSAGSVVAELQPIATCSARSHTCSCFDAQETSKPSSDLPLGQVQDDECCRNREPTTYMSIERGGERVGNRDDMLQRPAGLTPGQMKQLHLRWSVASVAMIRHSTRQPRDVPAHHPNKLGNRPCRGHEYGKGQLQVEEGTLQHEANHLPPTLQNLLLHRMEGAGASEGHDHIAEQAEKAIAGCFREKTEVLRQLELQAGSLASLVNLVKCHAVLACLDEGRYTLSFRNSPRHPPHFWPRDAAGEVARQLCDIHVAEKVSGYGIGHVQ
mmetsp:Transcript_179949/g.570973  ORF Transcript_179949/g.570973 Transcript_179949/m.570973 type:complete len:404 (+) Transcript_179949:548-1759(+)